MNLKDKSKIEGNRLDKTARPGEGGIQTRDIRKSTLDKMQKQPVKDFKPSDKMAKPGNLQKPANLQKLSDNMARPANLDRPVGKPKPAAKIDNRPKNVSPLGDVTRGRDAIKQSNRGNKAMGGGFNPPKMSGGGAAARRRWPCPSTYSGLCR